MDLSLENIWRSWFKFKKGKKYNSKMHIFQYNLEKNLKSLYYDLNNGNYKHGEYRKFTVCDNKKREISVCPIRDRIVHRLIYDYLCGIYDKTFIYDAWSCRKRKGLTKALERTQKFLRENPNSYIWRADIKKFFDNVNHGKLEKILRLKIKDEKDIDLLKKIIDSFNSSNKNGISMAIGNLTSQIFSNIYLNELDRFVKHEIKPKAYLRYGDDFIIINRNRRKLSEMKVRIAEFLRKEMRLEINDKNQIIIHAKQGLKFLGTIINPISRRLNKRNRKRILRKLDLRNIASYHGAINENEKSEYNNLFLWETIRIINKQIRWTNP